MIFPIAPCYFESIVEMFRFLRLESPEYGYVADDPEYVLSNMRQLYDAGLLIGAVDADKRGAMVGCVGNTWFSRNLEASEQLLFVYPPYRGSSLAARLIKEFEQQARNKNAEILHVGISTGLYEAQTTRLYGKLGFRHKGTTLMKRLT